MTNASQSHIRDVANAIFAQLNPQDVEQFYASYQLWTLQQRITEVQAQIATLAQQLADNAEQMQQVHPSAIALAALARLQSNGVNDIDLLDRMLERGEGWLDRTMQRLDYCEKFDFIRGNYTEWCEHALEGAYDWIDSVEETPVDNDSSHSPSSPPALVSDLDADTSINMQNQTTEEMLLQKLMSDEDEAAMSAPTLKIAAISPTKAQTSAETPPQEQLPDRSTEQVSPEGQTAQTNQTEQTNQTDQSNRTPAAEEVIPGELEQSAMAQPVTPGAEEVIVSENEQPEPISASPSTSQNIESGQAEFIPVTDEDLVTQEHSDEPPTERVQAEYIPPSDEQAIPENDPMTKEVVPPLEQNDVSAQPVTSTPHGTFQAHQASLPNQQNVQSAPKRGLLRRLFATFFSRP